MPRVALRSHVVETRLEWHTQPNLLSNEHSAVLQFWMIVQVGIHISPDCFLSTPCSGRWARRPWTCGTGSWCWWWRRASAAGAGGAGSCGGSASCIFHTEGVKRRITLQSGSAEFLGFKVLYTYMVGLLPGVYAQVALQRLQVTEPRSTDLTGIWLLARVDQHMGTKVSNLKHWKKKEELEEIYRWAGRKNEEYF